MTRKEIDKLIKISKGQVEYALRNLRRILEQDEARGQETRWTKLLIGHKDLIEVLKQQKQMMNDQKAISSPLQYTQTNNDMVSNEKVIGQQEMELRKAEADLANTLAYVQSKGVKLPDTLLDIGEWLTIKRYAERRGLTTQVVTNWIARGIIPTDCVRTVPELNDLRLVKDKLYR